jgi:hypothetical protein
VQLDLSNYNVDVVNTTNNAVTGVTATARVYGLDNKLLSSGEQRLDSAANATVNAFKLDLDDVSADKVVLVKLEMRDSGGKVVSDNLYWLAGERTLYRQLNRLAPVTLSTSSGITPSGDANHVRVHLKNESGTAALMSKLTLTNASDGTRILPAYLSDNYFSLLPGEVRDVDIEYATSASHGNPQVMLRGWNVAPTTIAVVPQK